MCQKDLQRRLRGKTGTKAERLKEDQASFLPLPAVSFDACRKEPTRANSLSLVRFDDNDYSVPVSYAHHEILVKGYVDRVVLCHKDTAVAEHVRSWGKEGVFFDYRHYLGLLERKPGSLDHARPLMDLHLPECFDTLRRRLEGEEEKKERDSGSSSGFCASNIEYSSMESIRIWLIRLESRACKSCFLPSCKLMH
jgi:hypothetical protein